LEQIPRSTNGKTDSLTCLAKELTDPDLDEIQVIIRNKIIISPAFTQEDENLVQERRLMRERLENYC